MISLVVAASLNHAIGKDNQLLWHLPNDLQFFRNTTWGGAVVMGRKTFDSIRKPLPGRTNIVITRQPDWQFPGVKRASGLDEAVRLSEEAGCREVFIIGGGDIYRQALPMADRIHLTRVEAVLDGDVFFPEPDPQQWELQESIRFEADEKNPLSHRFERWERRAS